MMKRLLKVIVIIFITILVLLLAGIALLNTYLTPSKLKTIISEQVNSHSNMELAINGELKWTFYPHLSLTVTDVELDNQNNPQEHINIGSIDVGIKLLPLLSKKLEPTKLTLNNVNYVDGIGHDLTLEEAVLKTTHIALDQAFPLDLFLRIKSGSDIINLKLLADTTVASDFNHIQLNNYRLDINQQHISGNLSVSGFNAPNPPNPIIQMLIIDGSVTSDQLSYQGITIKSVDLIFHGQDGIYSASPISLKLYNGPVTGSIRANLQNDTPRYSIKTNSSHINIDELLNAITGKAYLSGKGSLTANLTTSGSTPDQLTQHLNGTIAVSMQDGSINDKALTQSLQQAIKLLGQHSSQGQGNKLKFKAINTNTTLKNGIGTLKGQLLSDDLTAKAHGTINLAQQTLNITLDTQYINSERTKDYVIPIYIRGKFEDPSIKLDSQHLLKQVAGEQSNKLLEKASKHLGNIDLSKLFGK